MWEVTRVEVIRRRERSSRMWGDIFGCSEGMIGRWLCPRLRVMVRCCDVEWLCGYDVFLMGMMVDSELRIGSGASSSYIWTVRVNAL